eukprot:364579-Chlamydomonas_euryale.AAC.4
MRASGTACGWKKRLWALCLDEDEASEMRCQTHTGICEWVRSQGRTVRGGVGRGKGKGGEGGSNGKGKGRGKG